MCHIIRRDTAAAGGAALSRPSDLSQLLSRQRTAVRLSSKRRRVGSFQSGPVCCDLSVL